MHNNYYFLRILSSQLRQILMYARLKQCFSQEKDELVLGFERQNGDDFYIKCSLGPQFSSLQFPDSFHRAGRNSIDLFSDLLLAEVQEVEMYENERAFGIHFLGNYVLVFKLFGNRANLILYRDGEYDSQFQKRLKKDDELALDSISRSIDQSFEAFQTADGEYFPLFPTLGKEGQSWLSAQGYENLNLNDRWALVQKMLQILEKGSFYVVSTSKGIGFTLFPPSSETLFETTDPIAALNQFYVLHYSVGEFTREKRQIQEGLERNLAKSQLYLQELEKQKVIRETNVPFEEIGNILMAFLHLVPEGESKVVLDDFYRNQPITIKLNSTLSPAANAENYYRKGKNFSKELAHWEENIARKQQEIAEIADKLIALSLVETRKGLKPFLALATDKKSAEELPFKQFEIEGWVIWVGKNAKNNDLLTLKYAKKQDIWLHARDVSGSHVIVRNPQNRTVPAFVIEKAASLAAYFSKRQTESLCPVIVTSKKYVRKTKDLLPGMVIVDREEEVVLVKPELWN
jgi:predicted ribosome quality control (RQC) complex YloA/Tae2 family protein